MKTREERKSEVERNVRLEGKYTFDRKGARSTLAFVGEHLAELVEEFQIWWAHHPDETRERALKRFEQDRFGELLYPAPHGMLVGAVRDVAKPDPRQTSWLPYKD